MINDREVWERIAESFDKTRRRPWSRCIEFIDSMEKKGLFLDIGCGNGRHLIPAARRSELAVGIDFSINMLKVCRNNLEINKIKNYALLQADARYLPFREERFDYVIFVASLHNIRGRDNRITALREMKRVLKSGGKALISIWSRWQDRFFFHFLKEIFLRNYEEFGDIEIVWKKDNINLPRFYHLYSRRE
ncbi:MAG TPA: class I SAM-dependent methyltransferase, partial [Thermoplasmatales archaeon]|nr:class I SAM-dependent methyltransferase [Thermoplasmatales archaeon]